MSSQSITSNTGSQLFVNTDTSKIFIGNNHTRQEGYINNSGYHPITLPAGTVMGRLSGSGVVTYFDANANDGSQYVLGILGNDLVIEAGDSVTASIVVQGRVAQEKVVLMSPTQTLDTVVSGRRVKDKIMGETVGILLVNSTCEMTDFDNS